MANFISLACRTEAFNSAFGQHMRVNHLDNISIEDIETVVNIGADLPYSRVEIISLLEVKLMFGKFIRKNCK